MALSKTPPTHQPELRIEAMQTVIPSKVSGPGLRRRISVSGPLRSELFREHLHLVFYYKKVEEDECGWMIAGWLKDSLNSVLSEHPVFAGRLQRGPGDQLAIAFNDSGVRLVQAQMDTTMSDFFSSGSREDAEAQLAFWKDVDEHNPQYSALFYAQVTNFHGDDYSIGMTSSILLADPLLMNTFIKRWAHIHNDTLAQANIPKIPMFYLPHFKKTGTSSTNTYTPLISSTPCNLALYKTTTFKLLPPAETNRFAEDDGACRAIASLCLDEAVRMLHGNKTFSKISIVYSDRMGDWKVMTGEEEGQQFGYEGGSVVFEGDMGITSWDDVGVKEVSFYKGNMPLNVSYHLESCPDEGMVLIMPPIEEGSLGVLICVTIPKKMCSHEI